MAQINLLPWREARRQELKKDFLVTSALMLALGAGIAKGATDRPIAHVDVAASAAEMLGYKASEEIAGQAIPELL